MSERNYWTRMRSKRLSRRAVLAASTRAGVGAAGLALVGCGSGDDDQAQQAQQTTASAQEQQVQQAAEQTAQQAAQQQSGQAAVSSGALLPGELTAEQEAAGLSPEEEWRLRYHWSKLQNLPGHADGPKYGGTWTMAHLPAANWNVLGPNASLMAAFAPMFYSQLIIFPMDDFSNAHYYENEGDLAATWETADETTAIFQLRDGITWQDKAPVNGRAMTAEDVKIAYDALRDGATLAPDYSTVQESSYSDVDSIDFDNSANTVTFNLGAPAAYLFNNMMNPFHTVISPEIITDDYTQLDDWRTAAGTGPFILDFVEQGKEWIASKNPNYWKKHPRSGMQLPFLDGLHGPDFINQRESEWAAWEAGDVDGMVMWDTFDVERALGSQSDSVVQVTAPPPGWQPYITFKDISTGVFADKRVRQALSVGMNRPEQKEGVYNGLAAAGYGQNWAFFRDDESDWGFREWPWTEAELGTYARFDAQEGRMLLDAAGYNDSNPLEFQFMMHNVANTYLNLFELVRDQWKRNLGVIANHEQIEVENWIAKAVTRDFTDALFTWLVGAEMDADGLSYGKLHSESAGNWYGIGDPDIDQWCIDQRRELDVDARSDILEKIRVRELDNMWRIFAVNPYRIYARRGYLMDRIDTYNAWNPGWGATNVERVWKNV